MSEERRLPARGGVKSSSILQSSATKARLRNAISETIRKKKNEFFERVRQTINDEAIARDILREARSSSSAFAPLESDSAPVPMAVSSNPSPCVYGGHEAEGCGLSRCRPEPPSGGVMGIEGGGPGLLVARAASSELWRGRGREASVPVSHMPPSISLGGYRDGKEKGEERFSAPAGIPFESLESGNRVSAHVCKGSLGTGHEWDEEEDERELLLFIEEELRAEMMERDARQRREEEQWMSVMDHARMEDEQETERLREIFEEQMGGVFHEENEGGMVASAADRGRDEGEGEDCRPGARNSVGEEAEGRVLKEGDAICCPFCTRPSVGLTLDSGGGQILECGWREECLFRMELLDGGWQLETVAEMITEALDSHARSRCETTAEFHLAKDLQGTEVDVLFLSCPECKWFETVI